MTCLNRHPELLNVPHRQRCVEVAYQSIEEVGHNHQEKFACVSFSSKPQTLWPWTVQKILTPLCGRDGDGHIHVSSIKPFSPDD